MATIPAAFPPLVEAAVTPVTPQERIETLDILRGVAIFAILIVNWTVDLLWDVEPWEGWTGVADQATYWLVQFFLNEKSWPIFAFLFGVGFAVQMERMESRGAPFLKLYSRRLAVLFAIGSAHFILTDRDILFMYALLGFLLLPLRKVSGRTLLIMAVACVLLDWTPSTAERWQQERRIANPATATEATREAGKRRAQSLARWRHTDRTYATGSFGEIVALRAGKWGEKMASWKSYLEWLADPFPPFLLGLYVGRRRIFQNLAAHKVFIRRAMAWSLGLGLIGATAFVCLLLLRDAPVLTRQSLRLLERFGSPALGFFYIGGLALLLEKADWRRLMRPLVPVGRMALTNYLLHSVVFVLLFFGYGLGLYGKVGGFGGLLLSIPVIVGEIVLSRWWLERFRFGPAEWLWRSATYGNWQPMRLGLGRMLPEREAS